MMSGHIIVGAVMVTVLWGLMLHRMWAEAVDSIDRTEERAPDRRYQNRPPVDRR